MQNKDFLHIIMFFKKRFNKKRESQNANKHTKKGLDLTGSKRNKI